MDKEQLLKLYDFIVEISEIKNNEWFRNKLKSKFKDNKSFEPSINNEGQDLLYELKRSKYYLRTIDRNIWKEALNYYTSILYADLKMELIHDYKEMKFADKADDIVEFTRRIVMQLENCLNAICILLKSHELIKLSPDKYRNTNTDLLNGEFSFFNTDGSCKQLSKISIHSKIFFAKQYYDIKYSYNDMSQMIIIRNKSSHRGEYTDREREIINDAKKNIVAKKSNYFVCYDTFWNKLKDLKK
jgi:hypothetical protein